MTFLVGEILVCLLAASVVGLLIGWLLKSVFANRRLSSLESEWDAKYRTLDASRKSEITDLGNKNDELRKDSTSLRNKIEALHAAMATSDQALVASKAQIKKLELTSAAQLEALNSAGQKSSELLKQQATLQQKLDDVILARDQEISALKKDINNARKRSESTATRAPNTSSVVAPEDDLRLKALNEKRENLIKEREQHAAREKLFTAQLTRGDDTRAYLDETVIVEPPKAAISETDDQPPLPAAPEQRVYSDKPAELPKAQAAGNQTQETAKTGKTGTLWDRVKSTVTRTVDKTKL